MDFSKKPRIAAIAAMSVLSAGSLSACAQEEVVNETAYCADKDGRIIDEDNCDDNDRSGGGGTFIWVGSYANNLRPGDQLRGGKSFAYNDSKSRAKYGLPKAGKITTGKGGFGTTTSRTVSKGGAFGSGGKGGGS